MNIQEKRSFDCQDCHDFSRNGVSLIKLWEDPDI